MSKNVFLITVMLVASFAFADYTYVIEDGDNFGDLTLYDHESLVMTGGQGHHLNLSFWSRVRIEGTSPLVEEGNGGIWIIDMMSYATLEMLNGDVHHLELGSDSLAVLSGGSIDMLWSYQDVDLLPPVVKGGAWIPDPHITMVSEVWAHDVDTNILTGLWLDGSAYEIQLIDVAGFDPAIENIKFVPEPISLLLFGLGAVAVRKRRV